MPSTSPTWNVRTQLGRPGPPGVSARGQRDLAESQPLELQEALHAAIQPAPIAGQGEMLDQALRDVSRRHPGLRALEQGTDHLGLLGLELQRLRLAEADRGRDVSDVVEAKPELAAGQRQRLVERLLDVPHEPALCCTMTALM